MTMRASIILDLGGNLAAQARRNEAALGGLARSGQRDMGLLARSVHAAGRGLEALASKYTAALAGAGVAYKSYRSVVESAQLDRGLIRVTQTAGASQRAAAALRQELLAMAKETGQSVDDLLIGFNGLVQSGLEWDKALAAIGPINKAMAVTGANAKVLSDGLTVAGEAFQFDLSKAGTATQLLDQMTVAGRLGNAELEDLSGIFSRLGMNAKAAGMSYAQTLGFIEQLSKIEKNPERLSTLGDSTLRAFTNMNYLKKASQATGVNFYNAKGERREAFDVLDDIAAKYKKLTTDAQRDRFVDAALGDADLETKKGWAALLRGGAIAEMRKMTSEIEKAGGTIAKDLPGALANSVDQVSRLKAALREATGKALQEFAGVTPVFVVNMPGGGLAAGSGAGGIGEGLTKTGNRAGRLAGAAKMAGRIGTGLAIVGTAVEVGSAWMGNGSTAEKMKTTAGGAGGLAGMWGGAKLGAAIGSFIAPGLGTAIGGALGGAVGYVAGKWGSEALAEKLTPKDIADAVNAKEAHLKIEVTGPATVRDLRTSGFTADVDTGLYMGAH